VRALRFVGALVAALVAHLLLVALGPMAGVVVDPFVVCIAFYALDGRLLGAGLAGCLAGLTEDLVSGGLFGLYGFAGTLVGFVAGRGAQLLSLDRRRFVALLFALAAVVQQISVQLVLLILGVQQEAPPIGVLALRALTGALIGSLLTSLADRTSAAARERRQQRQPRVSWGMK